MLAIITGTIRPSQKMKQLVLRDENERFKQYEEGLRFLLESRDFSKVIFCENSGFGAEKLSCLIDMVSGKDMKLELLSFQGDVEKACTHGKGYGEGEIMKYVFSHSRLILGEPFFVKMTGRLKVDNIGKMVKHLDPENTYFNIPNRTKRDIYDTRIYGMPCAQFKKLFMDIYTQVMDEQGIFLESVYTQVIRDNKINITNFPYYPRITGVSGSGGSVYGYTEWKCKIRDIFSKVNAYRVK